MEYPPHATTLSLLLPPDLPSTRCFGVGLGLFISHQGHVAWQRTFLPGLLLSAYGYGCCLSFSTFSARSRLIVWLSWCCVVVPATRPWVFLTTRRSMLLAHWSRYFALVPGLFFYRPHYQVVTPLLRRCCARGSCRLCYCILLRGVQQQSRAATLPPSLGGHHLATPLVRPHAFASPCGSRSITHLHDFADRSLCYDFELLAHRALQVLLGTSRLPAFPPPFPIFILFTTFVFSLRIILCPHSRLPYLCLRGALDYGAHVLPFCLPVRPSRVDLLELFSVVLRLL